MLNRLLQVWRSSRQGEQGMTLIETLVAITLLMVVVAGTATGLVVSLDVTRDSRERTVAANLATAEMDRVRTIRNDALVEGVLTRTARVGNTVFTVLTDSRWTLARAEADACTAFANSNAGLGRRFLEVNVAVTWEGQRGRPGVRSSTIITPAVSSYQQGRGHIAVLVTDASGAAPASGVVVRLEGGTVNRQVLSSTSIGCAFFADLPPGPYRLSIDQVGGVDEEDRTQLGVEDDVVVEVGKTASATFIYDRAGRLELQVRGEGGGEVPPGLLVSAAHQDYTSAPVAYDAAASAWVLDPLFPYPDGWRAWAGCAHNRPDLFGQGSQGFQPGPGPPPVAGTLDAGTLTITIASRDSARANLRLYAQDQAPIGAPCDALVEVGSFDADGRLPARSVVLPYGDWRLFVEGSVVARNGDPSKTADNGLIEVRPDVTATYTEPLAYLPEVLADGPFLYYRFDETPSFSAADSSGSGRTGSYQPGVIRGFDSFTTAAADRSIYLDGTTSGFVATPTTFSNPNPVSVEIWFRTTFDGYAEGGKLAGFGNTRLDTSNQFDRHLYMSSTGQLYFGVFTGVRKVITSPARYNDGRWHHAVATLGSAGLVLYVDGAAVASNAALTSAENYVGYPRVGYDNLNASWPGGQTDARFQGYVDEYAFYTTALTPARVTAHWDARASAAYPGTVTADAPQLYYRFNDNAFAQDSSGNGRLGAYQGGATGGIGSALLNDANTAIDLDGTVAGYVPNVAEVPSPASFSIEAWFRATTGNGGGRLVGFGNALTGTSTTTTSDRHLYMGNDGGIVFGVYGATNATRRVVESPAARSYADGDWHHVVGTLGPGSMSLYVDGMQVASSIATVATTNYTGYWRVGADTLSGWPNAPSNTGFNGEVDEVAVYTSVLSPQRVAAHYAASGR